MKTTKENISNQQSINISNSQNVSVGNITLNARRENDESNLAKTPHEEVENIRTLIAEGKVREALEVFLAFAKGNDGIYEQLILLLGQLSKVETESRIGILEKNDERIQTNRISTSLLELTKAL